MDNRPGKSEQKELSRFVDFLDPEAVVWLLRGARVLVHGLAFAGRMIVHLLTCHF